MFALYIYTVCVVAKELFQCGTRRIFVHARVALCLVGTLIPSHHSHVPHGIFFSLPLIRALIPMKLSVRAPYMLVYMAL